MNDLVSTNCFNLKQFFNTLDMMIYVSIVSGELRILQTIATTGMQADLKEKPEKCVNLS